MRSQSTLPPGGSLLKSQVCFTQINKTLQAQFLDVTKDTKVIPPPPLRPTPLINPTFIVEAPKYRAFCLSHTCSNFSVDKLSCPSSLSAALHQAWRASGPSCIQLYIGANTSQSSQPSPQGECGTGREPGPRVVVKGTDTTLGLM